MRTSPSSSSLSILSAISRHLWRRVRGAAGVGAALVLGVSVPAVGWADAAGDAAAADTAPAQVGGDEEVDPVDYDELATVRVLERDLLPSATTRVEQLEMGFGVPANDRLALAGEPPVRLLLRGGGDGRGEGIATTSLRTDASLQVQLDHSLSAALDQIQADLAVYLDKDTGKISGLQQPFGIDAASQPAVQTYLALFTERGATTIKTWMRRSGHWRDVVEPILIEEGVPLDLYYLAMIESGYRPTVKSPANAGGMWQFVPGTAADMGLRIDAYVDERFDPVKATRAAARYLKKQHDRFGNWPLAMAAYNGGAGTVDKGIRTFNSNDYFKLVDYGAMYEETRRYVPRILAAGLIGKNPQAFGFAGLAQDPAITFDEVEVPGDVRLSLLAEAAGCSLEELEGLNPELIKQQTPPLEAGQHYVLRIPAGKTSTFVDSFDNLAGVYGTEHESHRLRFGESVAMVADHYGVAERTLRQINGLSRRERAPYGSELIVPTKLIERRGAEKQTDEPPVVLVPDLGDEFEFADRERFFYAVNHGDSLDELAEHFGLRRVEIALWNDLDPSAKLRDGLVLQLFLPTDTDTSAAVLSPESEVRAVVIGSKEYDEVMGKRGGKRRSTAKSYKVKRGDTVSKIAKRNGVSTDDIIKWNNLGKKAIIKPGMRLVIHK